MSKVVVAGVGMIPFVKPGTCDPYDDMGEQAARLALSDAGVDYSKVEQAYVGWVYGDSTAGQAAIYKVGLPDHGRWLRHDPPGSSKSLSASGQAAG